MLLIWAAHFGASLVSGSPSFGVLDLIPSTSSCPEPSARCALKHAWFIARQANLAATLLLLPLLMTFALIRVLVDREGLDDR